MTVRAHLAAAALAAAATPALADREPDAGMLRHPDVSATQIVFVYANDLWLVDRGGGTAVPLASPPGSEAFPRFDEDGTTIAFVGNYDGNRDLYTIAVDGKVPVRVTHHPTTEYLNDWTPGGRLLFSAGGIHGNPRAAQLFFVGAGGGLPEQLPLPYGANGAISDDGEWLAYTPYAREARTWKRYRGGMAADIWLFNLRTHESRKITDWEGTDTIPMWHGDTVYYLSDAGRPHKLNIWSFDTATGRRTQVTRYEEYDVKWPSIGPGPRGRGEIVFQNGPHLYLLDLGTNDATRVRVSIPGARPTIREKRVDASGKIQWWHISSTGKRAVVQARGDVWTLPAENGSPRNLTRTSGVAEREPSWSPDGRSVAYFADATGEYELYVMPSNGKGEPRQLTRNSATFYNDPVWSPDSKRIAYVDMAANVYVTTVETGETKIIDQDPWGYVVRPNWSHDSRWITYERTDEDQAVKTIRLYNVETGEKSKVTSGMFPDTSPVFDRKGDYLYFASNRSFSPTYSDIDTTFVYNQGQVLIAVPLREDVEAPWPAKSDEEEWEDEADDDEEDDEEDAEDDDEGDGDAPADDADAEDDGEDGDAPADDAADAEDDGVSGTWEGGMQGEAIPPGMEFVLTLTLGDDGKLTGSVVVPIGTGDVEGTYDADSGAISGTITTEEGVYDFTGSIRGPALTMEVSLNGELVTLTGTRTAKGGGGAAADGAADEAEAREVVEIDIEGFEERAIMLPVEAGNFANLAVNDKNQLLYARFGPGSPPSIMLFDLADEKKEEKSVAKGAGAFEISGDGKKICYSRAGTPSIQGAAAGASGKPVVTAGMFASIRPREEWEQVFTDAWRLQRDFFYVDNMHGVDWTEVRDRYAAMLDDCVTREDVGYVIREMIGEINVGHAYYVETDDIDQAPEVPVGLLGADWELANGAYRIAGICEGAPWDVDAKGPLSGHGVDVHVGDYVLAVNGVPVDTARDPWAAFIGLAGRTVTLTVSAKPEIDDEAREVAVRTITSEENLRYREWIEKKRQYVEERTGGQVAYIYVPNTGVDGQNDLVRQYIGQLRKKAMIIDERWNGGGQIPTRFIEMLNRPVTNYWARRHGREAAWPPDAHRGPKCMLINGRAGSGGDMFPFLFRQAGLGKLIGTRTWGGLVGISGNPGLIDGSRVTVPTFGFYEKDGTWGIEGHGVDPDIEVLDDPAEMSYGGDPQLDAAIALMLEEIERNPYVEPARPAPPDRSGMGVAEEDR